MSLNSGTMDFKYFAIKTNVTCFRVSWVKISSSEKKKNHPIWSGSFWHQIFYKKITMCTSALFNYSWTLPRAYQSLTIFNIFNNHKWSNFTQLCAYITCEILLGVLCRKCTILCNSIVHEGRGLGLLSWIFSDESMRNYGQLDYIVLKYYSIPA